MWGGCGGSKGQGGEDGGKAGAGISGGGRSGGELGGGCGLGGNAGGCGGLGGGGEGGGGEGGGGEGGGGSGGGGEGGGGEGGGGSGGGGDGGGDGGREGGTQGGGGGGGESGATSSMRQEYVRLKEPPPLKLPSSSRSSQCASASGAEMRAMGGRSPRGPRTSIEPDAHSAGDVAQSAPPLRPAPSWPMAPSRSCSASPGSRREAGESRSSSSEAVGQLHVAWARRRRVVGARRRAQSVAAGSPAVSEGSGSK